MKGLFTFFGQCGFAVQGGIPMTAKGESAAHPPVLRSDARRRLGLSLGFHLCPNIPAGGAHSQHGTPPWGAR